MILTRFATRIAKPLWFSVINHYSNVGQLANVPLRTITTGRKYLRFGQRKGSDDEPDDISLLDPFLGNWYEMKRIQYTKLELKRFAQGQKTPDILEECHSWLVYSRIGDEWYCKIMNECLDNSLEYTFKLNTPKVVEGEDGLPLMKTFVQDGETLLEITHREEDPNEIQKIVRTVSGDIMTAIYSTNDQMDLKRTYVKTPTIGV